MPGYLLDTQTIRYWFDGPSGPYPAVHVAAQARRSSESPVYVSAITLGEIRHGCTVHAVPDSEYAEFIRTQFPQILDVTRHTADEYGRIRPVLFEKFAPRSRKQGKKQRAEELIDPVSGRELGIDENDLWLVAHAVERNLILVTHDKMLRIREALVKLAISVRIEDWASDM